MKVIMAVMVELPSIYSRFGYFDGVVGVVFKRAKVLLTHSFFSTRTSVQYPAY